MSLFMLACNVGNAPQGTDASQVQAELAKEDPQKQIEGLQHAPIPPAAREQKIQEIEKKYGIKRQSAAPAGLPGGPGAAGK